MEHLPIDYPPAMLCQLFRKEPLLMEAAYFWLLKHGHGYHDLEIHGKFADTIEANKDLLLEAKHELAHFELGKRLEILASLLKCATDKRAEEVLLEAMKLSARPRSAIRLPKIEGYKGLFKTGWMRVATDYTALLQDVTGDQFFQALDRLPLHLRMHLKALHGHVVFVPRIYAEDLEFYTALQAKFKEQTDGMSAARINSIVQNVTFDAGPQHELPTQLIGQSHGKEC